MHTYVEQMPSATLSFAQKQGLSCDSYSNYIIRINIYSEFAGQMLKAMPDILLGNIQNANGIQTHMT
jgi:hypothetical protein